MSIDELFADFLAISSDLEKYTTLELWELFPDYISLPRRNSRKQELKEYLGNLRDKARQFCDLYREQFRLFDRGAVVVSDAERNQPYIIESVEVRWRDDEADVTVHLCEMRFIVSSIPIGSPTRKLHINRYSISWMLFAKSYRRLPVDFLNPEWMSKLKPLLLDIVAQIPDTVQED